MSPSCPAKISVAAYALGTLDAAERREMAVHLESCPACQAALESVAGLPGLLARVPAEEAAAGPAAPDEAMFGRLLAAAVAERRGRRRRWLAAAAVAAVVAAGGVGAGLTLAGGPAATELTAASGPVHAQVWLQPSAAGTALRLQLTGVPVDERCRLVAVAADGHRQVAASWEVNYSGSVTVSVSTAIPRAKLAKLVVETFDHHTLVTVPVVT